MYPFGRSTAYPAHDPDALATHVSEWFARLHCPVRHEDIAPPNTPNIAGPDLSLDGYVVAGSQRLSYQMEGGNWMWNCSNDLQRLADKCGCDEGNASSHFRVVTQTFDSSNSRYTFIDVTLYRRVATATAVAE